MTLLERQYHISPTPPTAETNPQRWNVATSAAMLNGSVSQRAIAVIKFCETIIPEDFPKWQSYQMKL